jgi:cleavage and polyadenylation specificity factor subunit 3
MQVDAISFSAHADFPQTSEFLDALQPPHVVLVHGEATEMMRLKKALEQHAGALGIPRTLYTPKVTQPVLIEHRAERTAKVVGRLGEKATKLGAPVRGLLVQSRGGGRALMHHEDLPRFTKLHLGRVVQRQAMPLHRPFAEVRHATFGASAPAVAS